MSSPLTYRPRAYTIAYHPLPAEEEQLHSGGKAADPQQAKMSLHKVLLLLCRGEDGGEDPRACDRERGEKHAVGTQTVTGTIACTHVAFAANFGAQHKSKSVLRMTPSSRALTKTKSVMLHDKIGSLKAMEVPYRHVYGRRHQAPKLEHTRGCLARDSHPARFAHRFGQCRD